MVPTFDTIVIGGGQAGLAAGYYLRRAALSFTILEAGARPTGSWPQYYDSLTLFSPARYSSLPGLPFPGPPGHYPARDEVVAYLAAYATHFQLPVATNTRVETVERIGDRFRIVASSGERYVARTVIAATGSFHRPYIPRLPGQAAFGGHILHSSAYRNPDPFGDRRVVVVGAGNSAVQIAVELARYADVTLATRKPLRYMNQRILGRDLHFWLWLTCIERLPLGRWSPLREANPVLDTGVYRAALAAGRPDRCPMFSAFHPDGVVWADGDGETVDVVLFATGYRPNLDYLKPIGAVDSTGHARQRGGVSLVTPGLYYVGLAAQRTFASATLRGVGADAAFVVDRVRRYLRAQRGR
jgi:putative flavoprotein involved in K+ transport